MNKKESKSWYKSYEDLGENKRYEYMMNLFDNEIPKDFINNMDLGHLICDIFDQLKRKRQFDKMLALYNKVYNSSHLLKDAFYMDIYPIDYYLYTQNKDKLKKCFKNFLSDPISSIDMFIPQFDKLIYNGYRELSFAIATDVFEKIKNGSGLISGAETDFGNMIYTEYMQNIYQDLICNKPINKNDIVNLLMLYDYDIKDYIDRIFELLEPKSFLLPDYSDYLKNKIDFLNDLALLFMRYMLDEKRMSFSASGDIWFVACNYFNMDDTKQDDEEYHDFSEGMFPWDEFDDDDDDDEEDEEEDEEDYDKAIDKQDSEVDASLGSFDTVFNLRKDKLDRDISGRMYFISNKHASGFAVSWGLVYVYDFLYKHKYISDGVYKEALEIIAENKDELISGYKTEIWEYAFVNTWEKPDSIDADEYNSEKEIFHASFEYKRKKRY